jgi:CRP/FNR family transcriptional regulator, dissimilatory nitrate respiration regulator
MTPPDAPLPDALRLLSLTPVFQGAPAAVLEPLAGAARFHDLTRAEELFREGDAVSAVHVVERGALKVFKLSRDGSRELTLHVEGPRQLVLGGAAFLERPVYPASCAALAGGARVLSLPAGVVRQAVYHVPALAQAVIGSFARRQSDLLSRVEQLFFTELGERLAAHLLEHAGPQGYALPTNSELASQLGTVPELVSRKLGEFYRQGFIRLERRRVWVVGAAEVRRLAGVGESGG